MIVLARVLQGWKMLLEIILQQSDRDRQTETGRESPSTREPPESRDVLRRGKYERDLVCGSGRFGTARELSVKSYIVWRGRDGMAMADGIEQTLGDLIHMLSLSMTSGIHLFDKARKGRHLGRCEESLSRLVKAH